MQKSFIAIGLSVMSLLLTACQDKSAENTKPEAPTIVEAPAPGAETTTDNAADGSEAPADAAGAPVAENDADNNATGDEEDPYAILDMESMDWLKLGAPAGTVIEKLSEPAEKGEDEMWGALGTYVQEWKYPEQGITLQMESEEKGQAKQVFSFEVTAPSKLKTKQGIGIGSTEADVANAYGQFKSADDSTDGKVFVAGSVYGGIIFTIEDGKVAKIFFGAAAE